MPAEATNSTLDRLRALIRDVPDFPQEGIVFKDITPLLADDVAFSSAIDLIVVHYGRGNVDKVVGIEARGFILASPVAYHFGAGWVARPRTMNGTARGTEGGGPVRTSRRAPVPPPLPAVRAESGGVRGARP